MRVLNLAWCDYCNFAYMNGKALNSIGIDCKTLVTIPHPRGYEESPQIATDEEMIDECHRADVVQVFHSFRKTLETATHGAKRIFGYHTGTRYRQHTASTNKAYNRYCERIFVDSPEFMPLGGRNVTYIATAIDTDKILYSPTQNEVPVFAHYPSNSKVKGTPKIIEMMTAHDVQFICNQDRLPAPENYRRMAGCDVYVELFAPEQHGKPYGSFGVTAFEAAAMGKQVITNSLFHHVYTQAYGKDYLLVANTETEFHAAVEKAKEFRSEHGQEIRAWIEDKHSLKATGTYLSRFL